MCGILFAVFEAVAGVLLSCVLLIPSVLAVLQNPRVDNALSGWSALLYNKNQRYIHILECFFFPPDIPARPNFTPDSESKWASLGAWLPLFSMTGGHRLAAAAPPPLAQKNLVDPVCYGVYPIAEFHVPVV